MIFLWIGISLICIFILYLLALMGRSSHPDWKKLEGFHYAHRGLHGKGIPENSMAAFCLAVRHGYGIELDVHLMKDGNLAVIHDASLLRTAGVDVNVEDLTLEQLSGFRLEGTEETIPSFLQVLDAVAGRVPLIVELKAVGANAYDLTDAVCQALKAYDGAYCIESFDPRCIRHLRKRHPHIIRGQLAENFLKGRAKLPWITQFLMTCQLPNFLTRPDFVAYRFSDRKRPGIFLARKVWGLHAVGWTIKTPKACAQAEKEGWIPIFEGFKP